MSENIRLTQPNFCIGPQTGTYCSVDVGASPVSMKVKNSSGTLIRTYTFSPNTTLTSAPYAYGSGLLYVAGQTMEVRTFVFDIANNYGDTSYMGVRSIEFYDENDNLISLATSEFTAYVTTAYGGTYTATNVFNTSLSKIGSASSTSWMSAAGAVTKQRLICKFNTVKYVKKIVVNNYHNSGGSNTRGARNVVVYYTALAYSDTTYGSRDTSFNTIFNSSFTIHPATNAAADQILLLESETPSSAGELVALKYVGPLNNSSFYTGAIFYTLERIPNGYRTYYTYNRDPDTGEYLTTSLGTLQTATEVEYYGNIVRKWRINNTSFTLDLVSSFYKVSDTENWFAANTFAIQTYQTTLLDHVSAGTGSIYFTTTSGLAKYDTILIGPSSDTDNVSAVEEVYIHSINYTTNEVEIRSYSGSVPTLYEYVEGDHITVIKYAHLPSLPKPLINSSNIRYAYGSSGGTLFTLDLNYYCGITAKYYGAMFSGVRAAFWNLLYNTFSFIKESNLLHFDLEQASPIKSQYLLNMYYNEDPPEIITIYDIDISGSDLYRLQKSEITFDTVGSQTLHEYTTYNYVIDTLEVYSSTLAVYASNTVIGYQGVSTVTAIVRDQFGVGLLGKDVSFSIEGDTGGALDPTDGDVVTDSNGVCSIQYTASAPYEGTVKIIATAAGANSGFGSAYIAGFTTITVTPKHTNTAMISNYDAEFSTTTPITTVELQKGGSLPILCFVRRSFPGGEWKWSGVWATTTNPTIEFRNVLPQADTYIAFLMCVYQPFFSGIVTDTGGNFVEPPANILPRSHITQRDLDGTLLLPSEDTPQDFRYISQNYVSRHLSSGNVVTATLNQFVFTQEAIPAFWSERNTPSINYWIRLRPYAYSLNPSTLEIHVYSVYYGGTTETINIVQLGITTTFDAGSGLDGIDFTYTFPSDFHNNSTVFVEVFVYDQAPVPNLIAVSYWFKIIPDYTKPYIENRIPDIEAYDVDIDTAVSFDVLDKGDGVDISTLEVFINNRQVQYSYIEYEPGQYNVMCIIEAPFIYEQEVKVEVSVNDISDNANLLQESWSFYCVSSAGPWFDADNVLPAKCVRGALRTMDDISVQVYAINSTGVDYNSLRLDVGGKHRNIKITPIIYRLK